MLGKIAVQLTKFALRQNLSVDDRNALSVFILGTLDALPLRGIISQGSEGEILINGQELDYQKVRHLRESAKAALDNQALKLIMEQVDYVAFTLAAHKVESERQMLFARAALWWGQQVQKDLELLAQKDQQPSLE